MLVISYGSDIVKMTYDALSASDIAEYIKTGIKVSLKPNLVVPGPASNGAVTHPEVTEGIILYLKDFGINEIEIIESSWLGADTKEAFRCCDYEPLSKKYNVPLIDLKSDKYRTVRSNGLDIEVCDKALETDFLINIPVLKAHCQTYMTCCLKNLKGCIPDGEKRRFHTLGIHRPVAVLNTIIKTGYCVVDGICGDLSFEEGGNPVTADRVITGRDPVAVDSYCAQLIGYHPDEIEYISLARSIGVGKYFNNKTDVIYLNADNKTISYFDQARQNMRQRYSAINRYNHLIDAQDACSACYSSLLYALHKKGSAGYESKSCPAEKIHIGQRFRGKTGKGLGVGSCTQGFDKCIKGCPPSALDIIGGLDA